MRAINWDTVVTSGVTAVIVTLAIEYVAKPRLEARRERILDQLGARRERLAAITKLTLSAQMYREDSAPQDLQRVWPVEHRRRLDDLQQQARQLLDDTPRYAQAYHRRFHDVLIGYATTVHAIVISMRQSDRKAALIADLGVPIATALEVPPRWQLWNVVWMNSAQQEVRRTLAKIGEDSASTSTPVELASRPDP